MTHRCVGARFLVGWPCVGDNGAVLWLVLRTRTFSRLLWQSNMARFLRPNIRSFVSSQLRMSSDQVKSTQKRPIWCRLNVFLKNNYRKYSVLCTDCLRVVMLTWLYVEAMLFLDCSHTIWSNYSRVVFILNLCLEFIYYIILPPTLPNTQASFWSRRIKTMTFTKGVFLWSPESFTYKSLNFLNDYTNYFVFLLFLLYCMNVSWGSWGKVLEKVEVEEGPSERQVEPWERSRLLRRRCTSSKPSFTPNKLCTGLS